MKKLLILILLLHGSFYGKAYHPMFGKQSTKWVTLVATSYFTTEIDTIYALNDTTLNNVVYKQIFFPYRNTYIREDTVAGKVWMYRGYQLSDTLIFDFSLQKGDTFDVNNVDYMYDHINCSLPPLNTVDTVYYENGNKVIEFPMASNSYGKLWDEPLRLTEGIGGTFSVVWKTGYPINLGYYLLCSYKDGVQTEYRNITLDGDCNPRPSAIKNVHAESDISIYPTPADETVFIKNNSTHKIISAALYAIEGKQLAYYAMLPASFDISSFQPGLYLLRLIDDEGNSIIKKIQKE